MFIHLFIYLVLVIQIHAVVLLVVRPLEIMKTDRRPGRPGRTPPCRATPFFRETTKRNRMLTEADNKTSALQSIHSITTLYRRV